MMQLTRMLLSELARDRTRDPFNENLALLFTNATKDEHYKFGHLLLFSKFGHSKGSTLNFKSDITNHYTEDNYSINDHWAISPTQYTLTGYIGEVINTRQKGIIQKFIETATKSISALSAVSPSVGSYTQSAINFGQQLDANINRLVQMFQKIMVEIGETEDLDTSNQEYIVTCLETLRVDRQLVQVYTPYGTYNDMAIIDVTADQQDTKYQSSIEIKLQQWRSTASSARAATQEEMDELTRIQNSLTEEGGESGTSEIPVNNNSTLLNMLNFVGVAN